jgi:hypothetical protein
MVMIEQALVKRKLGRTVVRCQSRIADTSRVGYDQVLRSWSHIFDLNAPSSSPWV